MNNLLTQKFPVAAIALLFVLTTSCSHEPVVEPEKPSGTDVHEWEDSTINGDAVMTRMMFSVSDGDMAVERNAITRNTTDISGTGTFSTGDYVAIAVTRNGSATETRKLYRVTSTGNLEYAGSDNEPFVWKSTSESVTIRAWSYGTTTNHSYTLTPPESREYTLEANQSSGYNELLYCKATNQSYSTMPMTLTFYHQLARVVINVNHERTGTLNVTSATIGSSTFARSATFVLPTGSNNVGSWTMGSTQGAITPKTETTTSGFQKTYSAVIFPSTYAQNTKFFTITNHEGNYVYNVSDVGGATLSEGNQYNYTITVKDIKDIRKNPLYYMAEYRLAENGTSFDPTPGWGVSYMRTYQNAMSIGYTAQTTTYDGYAVPATPKKINGVAYHLPTRLEWLGIVPLEWYDDSSSQYLYTSDAQGTSLPAATLRSESCTFGYSNATKYKNGSNNTSNTGRTYQSYWSNVHGNFPFEGWPTSTVEATRYAIRFIGTDYCSVWRYKTVGTPGTDRRLEISSRLIDPISSSDITSLNSKIAEIESASESYWTDATWGGVKRTIYWGGHTDGNGRAYNNANFNGHYVSTTVNGSSQPIYYNMACTSMSIIGSQTEFGMDLLLFRNE